MQFGTLPAQWMHEFMNSRSHCYPTLDPTLEASARWAYKWPRFVGQTYLLPIKKLSCNFNGLLDRAAVDSRKDVGSSQCKPSACLETKHLPHCSHAAWLHCQFCVLFPSGSFKKASAMQVFKPRCRRKRELAYESGTRAITDRKMSNAMSRNYFSCDKETTRGSSGFDRLWENCCYKFILQQSSVVSSKWLAVVVFRPNYCYCK